MPESDQGKSQWPIIGHSNIASYLQHSLNSLGFAHAYLFVGPSHVGKSTMAEYFTNSLVCRELEKSTKQAPCGACQSCKQVAAQTHPDVFWLKREVNEKTDKLKKNISIDQVRALQAKLSLGSFMDTYKVAVIDEAHTLSLEAANSLLKTLEEPAKKTILILLASNLVSLPQTITSRCQVLKFLPVNSQEIYDHLVTLKIDKKKAKTLAAISYGRPGVALNFDNNKEEYQDYLADIRQFLALSKASLNEKFRMLGEMFKKTDIDSTKHLLDTWVKIIRDSLLIKNNSGHFVNHLSVASELQNFSEDYDNNKLVGLIAEIEKSKQYLNENVNTKLVLENLVLTF